MNANWTWRTSKRCVWRPTAKDRYVVVEQKDVCDICLNGKLLAQSIELNVAMEFAETHYQEQKDEKPMNGAPQTAPLAVYEIAEDAHYVVYVTETKQ